jgi:hypothetical protein
MIPTYHIGWIQDCWNENKRGCARTFAEYDSKHPDPKKCYLNFGEHHGREVSELPEDYKVEFLDSQKIRAVWTDPSERRERKDRYQKNGHKGPTGQPMIKTDPILEGRPGFKQEPGVRT